MKTLIKVIAGELERLHRPVNEQVAKSARHNLAALSELLPSGAGIDSGTQILVDDSTPNRIRLVTAYHHMNDAGYYDGWTQHTVIVTPGFVSSMEIKISGKDRNGIKDYIADVLQFALNQPVVSEFDSERRMMRYSIGSEL